jgi:hypothetical protein
MVQRLACTGGSNIARSRQAIWESRSCDPDNPERQREYRRSVWDHAACESSIGDGCSMKGKDNYKKRNSVQDKAVLGALVEKYIHVASDPYPKEIDNLRALAKSLVRHITKMNPKRGRSISALIHMATVLEAISSKDSALALIQRLEMPEPERFAHWAPIVQFQVRWLENYLDRNKILDMPRVERWKWFNEKKNEIHSVLVKIKCVCRYSSQLKVYREEIEYATGNIQLMVYILSALHGMKNDKGSDPFDTQMYKLMKQKSSTQSDSFPL